MRPEATATPEAEAAPKAARGRPRDPDIDDEILAASAAIVAESGLSCLTMDAVARRAGVAKATIYRRFPGKVDLIAATCGVIAPPLPDAPDTGNVRDDLIEIMGRVVDLFGDSAGDRMMPSVIAASATNPDVREALSRFSSNRRSRLAKVLRRAAARGELVDDIDVDLIADQLVGAVVYRLLVTGRSLSPAFQAQLVDQVLHGVLPR
jgi:AcrR family transcriptional regulator